MPKNVNTTSLACSGFSTYTINNKKGVNKIQFGYNTINPPNNNPTLNIDVLAFSFKLMFRKI